MTHLLLIIQISISAFIGFITTFLLTKPFVKFIDKFQVHREMNKKTLDGKEATIFMMFHKDKGKIATMGGLLMLFSAFFTIFVLHFTKWDFLDRGQTWLPIFAFFSAGLLGAFDDLLKSRSIFGITRLSPMFRLFTLGILSFFGGYWFYFKLGWDSIHIPGIGDFTIGIWYIPLFILIVLSMANAVNITDGLDGLSGGLLILSYAVFAILAFVAGFDYLVVFIAMIIGILIAYVWYNVNPALYLGGDSYSYSMGAGLGVVAIMTNSLIPLFVVGSVFFAELMSSFIQIMWKKIFKKKLIPSAPFHNTLQYIGWKEPQIVMRLWIIGGMFAVIGCILGLIGMGDMFSLNI